MDTTKDEQARYEIAEADVRIHLDEELERRIWQGI